MSAHPDILPPAPHVNLKVRLLASTSMIAIQASSAGKQAQRCVRVYCDCGCGRIVFAFGPAGLAAPPGFLGP